MRKSIAEASKFRHILPDAVSGGREGPMDHGCGMLVKPTHINDLNGLRFIGQYRVLETFVHKRFEYSVGTGAAPCFPACLPEAAHH